MLTTCQVLGQIHQTEKGQGSSKLDFSLLCYQRGHKPAGTDCGPQFPWGTHISKALASCPGWACDQQEVKAQRQSTLNESSLWHTHLSSVSWTLYHPAVNLVPSLRCLLLAHCCFQGLQLCTNGQNSLSVSLLAMGLTGVWGSALPKCRSAHGEPHHEILRRSAQLNLGGSPWIKVRETLFVWLGHLLETHVHLGSFALGCAHVTLGSDLVIPATRPQGLESQSYPAACWALSEPSLSPKVLPWNLHSSPHFHLYHCILQWINISPISKLTPYSHLGKLIDILAHIFTLWLTLSMFRERHYLVVMSHMHLDLNTTAWLWLDTQAFLSLCCFTCEMGIAVVFFL